MWFLAGAKERKREEPQRHKEDVVSSLISPIGLLNVEECDATGGASTAKDGNKIKRRNHF